jgi:hypothetical protein
MSFFKKTASDINIGDSLAFHAIRTAISAAPIIGFFVWANHESKKAHAKKNADNTAKKAK